MKKVKNHYFQSKATPVIYDRTFALATVTHYVLTCGWMFDICTIILRKNENIRPKAVLTGNTSCSRNCGLLISRNYVVSCGYGSQVEPQRLFGVKRRRSSSVVVWGSGEWRAHRQRHYGVGESNISGWFQCFSSWRGFQKIVLGLRRPLLHRLFVQQKDTHCQEELGESWTSHIVCLGR